MKADTLALTVHGMNEVQRVGQVIANQIAVIMPDFVGKKVLTNDGLTKKFADSVNLYDKEKENGLHQITKVEKFENGYATISSGYITSEYGNLRYKFSLCFNGGTYEDKTYYCQYFHGNIDLGKIQVDKLESIQIEKPQPKISLEDELSKIKLYKILLERTEIAKRAISLPEGIYKYL